MYGPSLFALKFAFLENFPETAWRAIHSCQATHANLMFSGFQRGNRLAAPEDPPSDA